MIRDIDITAIVSITTGRMFSDFMMLHDAVRDITGQDQDLATIGVAMSAPAAKQRILEQYPNIPTELIGEDYDDFLMDVRSRFGDYISISI